MPLRSHPDGGFYVEDGGARLKALRALLGFRNAADFAGFLNINGLGSDTLTDIEAPGRPRAVLFDHQAEAIAERCGVPDSFFFAELEKLGDVTAGPAAAFSWSRSALTAAAALDVIAGERPRDLTWLDRRAAAKLPSPHVKSPAGRRSRGAQNA